MSTGKDKKTEPMDVTVIENKNPVASANHQRNCYAMKTLIMEVTELFPETTYEVSNYDGRNVALDVQFTVGEATPGFTELLLLMEADPRVSDVLADLDGVLVSFRPSARTQDSRESFGLADAWSILTEGEVPC